MLNLNSQSVSELFQELQLWLESHLLVLTNFIQLGIVILLAILSLFISRHLKPFLHDRIKRYLSRQKLLTSALKRLNAQLMPSILIIFLWIVTLIYNQLVIPASLLSLVLTLLVVWVVIKVISASILDRFWSKTVSILAWIIAALSILDVLVPMLDFLDKVGFHLGDINFSILTILKAIAFLIVSLRAAKWIGTYTDKQLIKFEQITPSAHVLISKSIGVMVYSIITLLVLDSIGVDLTAFAVFGGALGVGIGFGLQKVASNLLSGIILLSDRSIKPGDVVQIGEVYGWISSLKSRYVSVVTRDGHEYLIPNEDLITQQVINWSYSDTRIRLKIPFGVSYKSNPHQVRELVLAALEGVPRILTTPPPICLLTSFGDSSLDLELRIWIDDPKNGTANITSDVLYRVWDTLKANGIEIPFPQRDLHIHQSDLNVTLLEKKSKDESQ
ncbi:MAG: mechanosensitive ion channel [Candidatus Marinimicrobia bacterium]|nr:mechanosensitive ion channel [Candidatus Neomarinimicrobiota bacterium]